MPSDLVVSVRQVSSYPQLFASNGGENVLVQEGGVGGPYASISTGALVSTALNDGGSFAVGTVVPGGATAGHVFTETNHVLPLNSWLAWNCYWNGSQMIDWAGGPAAGWGFGNGLLTFDVASGAAGAPLAFTTVLELTLAGAASLPYGTLTVARDPSAALEVATMGWVGNNTVASFNGRKGAVWLTCDDIYSTLGLRSPIATEQWVTDSIGSSLNSLLTSHPFVFSWNGRCGNVFLTLSDITCVFFQSGQQPIAPNPPTGSDDYSIATTAWVVNAIGDIVTDEINSQGLASKTWVQANTVASFNTRIGAVTLTLLDVTGVGGAPINSPSFTGLPTAPTANFGQATAQIATTAFVQQAVQASVTGVVSFNNRTGAIDLTGQDIYDAGGALQNSPAFSGTPTAPTAGTGTSTTQLATTAFVMNEVAAVGAGVTTFNTRSGNVVLELPDITAAGGAPIASPAFSGEPTCPTPLNPLTSTANVANTAWVVQFFNLQSLVSSFNGRTGAVTLNANDLSAAGALVNPSPALTGQPTAPTAVPGTNTTQLATTAYVTAALAALSGVTVSPTPPSTPYMGQAWFNSTTGVQRLNVWTGAAWLPATDLSGYLPLVGGTITGTLGVTGTLTTTTSLAVAVAAGNNAAALFNVAGVRQWWCGTNSAGSFNIVDATGATSRLSIDINGNFAFNGNVAVAGNLTGTNVYANASVFMAYPTVPDFWIGRGGSFRYLNWANNWFNQWNESNGTRSWNGPGGQLMALDGSGNLTVTAAVFVPVVTGGPGGAGSLLSWGTSNRIVFRWGAVPNSLNYRIDEVIEQTLCTQTNAQLFAFQPNASAPVGVALNAYDLSGNLYAAYIDQISDVRIKEGIEPTQVDALALIDQIPVRQFDIKARVAGWLSSVGQSEDERRAAMDRAEPWHGDIGFIAQELGAVVPEAVSVAPATLPAGLRRSEDNPLPDDVQCISLPRLVPYLLRGEQQLAQMVKDLTERVAVLEGQQQARH